MSDSGSDIEAPMFTSTQVDTMEKCAFARRFKSVNVTNVLKVRANAKHNAVALESSRTNSLSLPTLRRQLLDDEGDSSYHSSNDSKRPCRETSSSSGDSETDVSDVDNNKKKQGRGKVGKPQIGDSNGSDSASSSRDSLSEDVSANLLQVRKRTTTNNTTVSASEHVQACYADMYHMEPISLAGAFDIGGISNDNEIFLVNIARDVDPATLLKSKVTFEGKQVLQLKNNATDAPYLVEFDKHDTDKLHILGYNAGKVGIRHARTSGSITVSKDYRVDGKSAQKVELKAERKVPFPADALRTRHPLFGKSFQSKIKLAKRVQKKLDALTSDLLRVDEAQVASHQKVKVKKTKKRRL